jgi:hypothetical protein
VTKDGVMAAKEIEPGEGCENMGARMVREVASKTSDDAGEGTPPRLRCSPTGATSAWTVRRRRISNVNGAIPFDTKRMQLQTHA